MRVKFIKRMSTSFADDKIKFIGNLDSGEEKEKIMTSTNRVVIVAVILLALLMNPVLLAWGNPPPGRWEKVAESRPGEKMIIFTKNGGQNTYTFRSLDNQFLHCVHPTIGDMQIGLDTIQEIVVPKAGKYSKHGIYWGALMGAGAMGIVYQLEPHSDPPWGGIIIGAGVGAAAGFLAGAVVGAPGETVYISKEAALAK